MHRKFTLLTYGMHRFPSCPSPFFYFPFPFPPYPCLLILGRLLRPSSVFFNSKHDRSLAYIFAIRTPCTTFPSNFPPSFYQAIRAIVSFAFKTVLIHPFKTLSPCTILLIPPYLIPRLPLSPSHSVSPNLLVTATIPDTVHGRCSRPEISRPPQRSSLGSH